MLPLDYYSLLDAFKHKGCPICFLLQRDAQRMLDAIFHEHVTEPEMHEIIRKRRGLCNAHGWQLTELRGHTLGMAILFRAAVDEALTISAAALPSTAASTAATSRLGRLLKKPDASATALDEALAPTGPCPICKGKAKTEREYQSTVAKFIGDEAFKAGYAASSGLCLPHFRGALSCASDPAATRLLVSMQSQKWQAIKDELSVLIGKYDYRRAQELVGDEGDSHLRAIRDMVGARGVFGE